MKKKPKLSAQDLKDFLAACDGALDALKTEQSEIGSAPALPEKIETPLPTNEQQPIDI